ncbi:MAG TPA: heavy-metal-associated domain-containing protein [Burkholderiaceae bacterium]|nr:heavy-metal-associated domain-containing protein [Burkholderiaceae bacterium]
MQEFVVPAMNCGHCVGVITQAVKMLDPKATIDADVESHTVRIDSPVNHEELIGALRAVGYPPA